MASRARSRSLALLVMAIATGGGACTCSKANDAGRLTRPPPMPRSARGSGARPAASRRALGAHRRRAGEKRRRASSPALDVPASAIRVQRISPKDEVAADRTVLDGRCVVERVGAEGRPGAARASAVTWRGLRGGKLVRQLARPRPRSRAEGRGHRRRRRVLRDARRALVHRRQARALAAVGSGQRDRTAISRRTRTPSLVCGAHRAFALLDEDDGTSLVVLGGADADAGADAGRAPHSVRERPPQSQPPPRAGALLKESDFGEDDQRERADYTVGDDLGVVRLGDVRRGRRCAR